MNPHLTHDSSLVWTFLLKEEGHENGLWLALDLAC